ncbi:MAG TPA: cob(I)yrinic acid a,c-diamide adenosyltransferase [Armatimonadota bacterium]|jgi:cob(I)alamin adenosyltransferase
MYKLSPALVHVYTGSGKGKTSAALGVTWRALGAGLRVYFLQFLKGGTPAAEELLADCFPGHLTFHNLNHPCTPDLFAGRPTAQDCRLAQEAWTVARGVLADPQYDLVVLDEINNTLHLGLVELAEVLQALRERPPTQEVICTGRGAPEGLVDFADLVTELREVKHPYRNGVPARRGVDF